MNEEKLGVAVDETAEEIETPSELPTENKEPDEETLKPESASTPKEPLRETKKIPVDYERFNEINKEAKLARRIKSHLGMDEKQIEELIERGNIPTEEEEPKPVIPTPNLGRRLSQMEEMVEALHLENAKQKEEKEWTLTVSEKPEIAPFQEQIIELGRVGKYRKMNYGDIYREVFLPAVERIKGKTTEKFQEKESAQPHKGKSVEVDYGAELTPEQFAKLPVKDKEKYLRQQGLKV